VTIRPIRTLLAVAAVASLYLTSPALAQEAAPSPTRPGILLLAHGGSGAWDANVLAIARAVDAVYPTEVAFGMATRANIQAAAERLAGRGVSEIVAVPLFVSSHSSVVRATEYLLGLREDAPRELAIFAKMSHGAAVSHGAAAPHPGGAPHANGASNGHHADAARGGHAGHTDRDEGTTPIEVDLPIRMTAALNSHPILGSILVDRAREISRAPSREAIILVAHGPTSDADNAKWLADLRTLATHLEGFASVDVFSLRDDAQAPVRDQATAELRAKVEDARAAGRDVLIVPVLLSYGGIERGLKTRLEGLEYRLPSQGIAPDARLSDWVIAAVGR